MKKLLALLFLSIFLYTIVKGQNSLLERQQLVSTSLQKYSAVIDTNRIKNPNHAFHPKMFNRFIVKEVEKYLSSVNDISLKQYYATLDNDDKSLLIGGGVKLNTNDITRWTLTGGIQLKGKENDKFYTFFNSDGFVESIGLKGKLTFFSYGSIYYDNANNIAQELLSYRVGVIEPAMQKHFESSILETSEFDEKSIEFIADKELEYIEKNKSYNWMIKTWTSVDFYLPFTEEKVATTLFSPDSLNQSSQFYNWSVSLSESILFKNPKFSGTFSVFGKVYNNNNILTESLSEKSFVKNIQSNPNQFNQVEEKSIYVGKYNEFTTSQLKGELVLLPGNEFIGFSAALEQNFGEYDALNWKLGIPFNFKDAEGKPSISFEVQWREVNKEHLIGISVGKAFGKYVD